MKNLSALSEMTKHGITPLYYSIKHDAVFPDPGDDRWYLTDLINYNSEEQIRQTVIRFMAM